MVQNAFWDYVGKTTMTSKEYVWHIRKSAPGKNLCELISTSIEAIYGFFNTVYTQVVLWTNDFYRKFCHEIDNLKYHMEEFMEDLEGGVLFHSTEMAAQLRCKMEDMKKYIAYYIESLDPKGLKECIMGQIQELHGEMYESCEYMQNYEHHQPDHHYHHHKHHYPKYTCDKNKIDEHMEEFQGIILLMVNNFEGQLDTTTNEINRKMAPRGKKHSVRMSDNEEEMNDQLRDMWRTWAANNY
ncbi:putative LOC107394957-like protein [Nothobranchius furzeri]|uniref:LOC107394957-like protein n=2 Tax=Nothobranchius furzeri TaxID=105023 RepID=A0A9D2Y258_NOTFU|nr:putative LOC107394957-like protein [Nothobranchius furzeri]